MSVAVLQIFKKYNAFNYLKKWELITLLQVFIGAVTGFAIMIIALFGVWSFRKPEDPIKKDYPKH